MINATIKQLSAQLAGKKISSVELTQLYLDRIEQTEPAAQRLHHGEPGHQSGAGARGR